MRSLPRFLRRKSCSRPNCRRNSICQSSSDSSGGFFKRDSFAALRFASLRARDFRERSDRGRDLTARTCRPCMVHASFAISQRTGEEPSRQGIVPRGGKGGRSFFLEGQGELQEPTVKG